MRIVCFGLPLIGDAVRLGRFRGAGFAGCGGSCRWGAESWCGLLAAVREGFFWGEAVRVSLRVTFGAGWVVALGSRRVGGTLGLRYASNASWGGRARAAAFSRWRPGCVLRRQLEQWGELKLGGPMRRGLPERRPPVKIAPRRSAVLRAPGTASNLQRRHSASEAFAVRGLARHQGRRWRGEDARCRFAEPPMAVTCRGKRWRRRLRRSRPPLSPAAPRGVLHLRRARRACCVVTRRRGRSTP